MTAGIFTSLASELLAYIIPAHRNVGKSQPLREGARGRVVSSSVNYTVRL
jgi:hypothetical protein